MAEITYFMVVPFDYVDDGIVAGEPIRCTFALCNGKGWIEQSADLLHCQVFDFNGIAPNGAKGIDGSRRV